MATKQLEDAEKSIKQNQEDTRKSENMGVTTRQPKNHFRR